MLAAAPGLSCGSANPPALRTRAEPAALAADPLPEHPRADPPRAAPPLAEKPATPQAVVAALDVASADAHADSEPADGVTEAYNQLALFDEALDARYPLYGVAFHALSQIFEKPDTSSFVIGLMRRGATLRASEPLKNVIKGHGCDGTWHELWTRGFVCKGRGFQLGRSPQTFTPSPAPALIHDTVPYLYAKNTAKVALQYFRLPSEREQADAQASFAAMQATLAAQSTSTVVSSEGAETDSESTQSNPLPPLVRMAMAPGFYVSVDGIERAGGREFVRTVRGGYVDAKALIEVTLPQVDGGVLTADQSLPIGLVYRDGAKLLDRDPVSGALTTSAALPRLARVALSGAADGAGNLQTPQGQWIASAKLRRAQPVGRPALVPKSARLIHVQLAEQTLVAYEGERAVYAALVSSGKQGFETPTGLFRVHAKHVSTTMDGLAGEEDEYSIEDVPWTLYFQGSYALHAAFWHERFGQTRSHGCINLSPDDARWLFQWATPSLPNGFHSVMATRESPGTYVFIE